MLLYKQTHKLIKTKTANKLVTLDDLVEKFGKAQDIYFILDVILHVTVYTKQLK